MAEKEYVGSHIGTRTGQQYALFFEELDNGFSFKAFDTGDQGKMTGCYLLSDASSISDPREFLDLPDNGIVPVTGALYSSVPRDGIGKILIHLAMGELGRRGSMHVVGFTDEGVNYIQRYYKQNGYKPTRIKKSKVPMHLRKLRQWSFKQY